MFAILVIGAVIPYQPFPVDESRTSVDAERRNGRGRVIKQRRRWSDAAMIHAPQKQSVEPRSPTALP
jgi:hypothetical protein